MKTLTFGLTAALLLHITPTVILVKKTDAVTRLLPGADAFTARESHLSNADAHRLHEACDWSPDDGVLTFYVGRHGTTTIGALTFVRVDTPHGPLEVAVGFQPDGAVAGVEVTKATVETKNWVQEAVGAGLTTHYAGLKAGTVPEAAAQVKDKVGSLPFYMAEQIDKGVARAMTAYGLFYR